MCGAGTRKFPGARAPRRDSFFVMPGLVPGIHVLAARGKKDVDGRDKPGHDEQRNYRSSRAIRLEVSQRRPPIFCTSE
jgi:hypothetical protein